MLRKMLNLRPYRLQVLQALLPKDKSRSRLLLSGKVNRHNVRIWVRIINAFGEQ
ncbi:hypothetical protein C0J52_15233 [Blattella germanica]|nr:hypothetical protein C0J52_15233 [Blattella germanica]